MIILILWRLTLSSQYFTCVQIFIKWWALQYILHIECLCKCRDLNRMNKERVIPLLLDCRAQWLARESWPCKYLLTFWVNFFHLTVIYIILPLSAAWRHVSICDWRRVLRVLESSMLSLTVRIYAKTTWIIYIPNPTTETDSSL